jgi:hypothetical protein
MPEDDMQVTQAEYQPRAHLIMISVAPAELIDKITILELKNERIKDAEKLKNVTHELAILRAEERRSIPKDDTIAELTRELKEVNGRIWDLEERIRECEHRGEFGPDFVETARLVHRSNDERAYAKRRINIHLGSAIIEEKSHLVY